MLTRSPFIQGLPPVRKSERPQSKEKFDVTNRVKTLPSYDHMKERTESLFLFGGNQAKTNKGEKMRTL